MMFGEKLGETKIEDFDGAAFGDENVGGLDVAMDDALFVGRVKSVSELDADIDGARNGKGAGGDEVVEGLTFEQRHSAEGSAIVFFDGVSGGDAGLLERGSRAGFTEARCGGLCV